MIIDSSVNCNTYEENILNHYGFWKYRCPCCRALRSFTRHAIYTRHICSLNFDVVVEKRINILRLACSSCNTTHAILPADTIPYCIYSFSCIFQVLVQNLLEEKSILEISSNNQISFQIIYLFLKRFINHFNHCITFLRVFLAAQLDFSASSKDVISIIVKNFSYIDFQREFFNHIKEVFFMMRSQNVLSRKLHIGSYFKPPT